jgi:hypothetical protein
MIKKKIEYNKFAEDLLIKSTEKFIETVLNDNKTKREECNKRLDAIKAQKKGDLVFYIPDGEHFIIRVVE